MSNYDNFAEQYNELTEEEQTRKHTYSLISIQLKDKKLLDVGCGSGQDAEYFVSKGAKVFGIDISKKQIEITKRKVSGNFIVGDMNKLPYKDNIFDIIVSTYVVQSSNNVTRVINEMIRVAKKGAEILVVAKHPFRNLLEGNVNDKKENYFNQSNVTSYIFNRNIKLIEPSHTMMEYLHSSILKNASLEIFEEHNDFPASDQVIKGLIYPTYMILKFRKK